MSAGNYLHFTFDDLPNKGLTPEILTYLEDYGLMKISLRAGETVTRGEVTITRFTNPFSDMSGFRIDSTAVARSEEDA